MKEKAMVWFDGVLFQAGTKQEFIDASKSGDIQEISGFDKLSIPQAQQMVTNLNKSNILRLLT